MNIFSDWFVFVRAIENQRHVSREKFSLKNIEQIGIGVAYLHVFYSKK